MEETAVMKFDDDGSALSSPSPDEVSTTSNGKAAAPTEAGRKTPDTPGSDTPTTGSTTPTPNMLTAESDEGEVKVNGTESTKINIKKKALAILGEDESKVNYIVLSTMHDKR